MASRVITIVGITGHQGSSVAQTFLELPDWRVRGITRNPSQASAQAWAQRGAEIVQADLKNTSSLIEAFKGSDVIFAMTDFLAARSDATVQDKIAKGSGSFGVLGKELELQCGMNVVDAAAAVMMNHKLHRFIFSTLSGVTYWSKSKYTSVNHFESKYETVQYMHQTYPELAKVASTVQLAFFYSNVRLGGSPRLTRQADGTYLVRSPLSAHVVAPYVDPCRDTGLLVEALLNNPPDTHVHGFGSKFSWNEWIDAFSKVHGVEVKFEKISRQELEEAFPDGWGDEYVSMFEYTEEFGVDGGDPALKSPSEIGVKAPLTTLEKFMETEDFSWVIKD